MMGFVISTFKSISGMGKPCSKHEYVNQEIKDETFKKKLKKWDFLKYYLCSSF